MMSISWKQRNNPLKKARREVIWLTLGLCLQWAHHISLWVQGNELKNAQEALPPLRTEAHGLLQAMAFKAERRNTTWEAHSQHTDGKEGKNKRKPCFVSPRKKIKDCCPLSIYTEQHSAYKSKYHGMGDHLHAYQPCFLTTDSHMSKPRTDGSTSTDGTQYKCLLSLYPNLIRYQKKKKLHCTLPSGNRVNDHALLLMLPAQRSRKGEHFLFKHTDCTDSTWTGKVASEDPTRPCEWMPQMSSNLLAVPKEIYHCQAKEQDG